MENIELRIRLNFRQRLSNQDLQELVDRFRQMIEAEAEEGVLMDEHEIVDLAIEHERIERT